MPEMNLSQIGLIYSAFMPFTKNKENFEIKFNYPKIKYPKIKLEVT